MAYERGRAIVNVGLPGTKHAQEIRDPRKSIKNNASPKKLANNFISGTWVFDVDTTGRVDIVLPDELQAAPVAAKASNIDTTAYMGPIVVAGIANTGSGAANVVAFVHKISQKSVIRLQLLDQDSAKLLKLLHRACIVHYIVDAR